MKAYIITVKGNELSEESANKTLQSAKQSGLEPEIYYGVNKYEAEHILTNSGLDIDNKDGVFTKVSYKESTIGCFLSHWSLWKKCINRNEPFVILEHDVNFYGKFDFDKVDKDSDGVINIGKPLWGKKWKAWPDGLVERFCKVPMLSFVEEYKYCDCEQHFLHGAHSYIITPNAAKKLIKHYTENGIVPADNSINLDVVKIYDYKPFICEQVRNFSLVQRDHPIQEFPDGFIYGDNAWGTKSREMLNRDISINELVDSDDSKFNYKKVMVFICDGNLLDKVKPLIHNAKTTGEWDGDFVLMVPESVDTDMFDSDSTNNLIIYKVPDLMDATIHFHKMFLFDDFFKEWDWVFYSDLDVWYIDKINLRLNTRRNTILYAPNDRLSYKQQFDSRTLDEPTRRFVMKAKPKNGKSFQTCWMLFSTTNKEWLHYYKTKITNYYFRYHIYQQIAPKGYWEQCVFNLVFSDTWLELGSRLVQSEAVHKVWDGEFTLDHLKRGYDDRTDYSDASGIHFTFPFAPWWKYNKRFYREWERVNNAI